MLPGASVLVTPALLFSSLPRRRESIRLRPEGTEDFRLRGVTTTRRGTTNQFLSDTAYTPASV